MASVMSAANTAEWRPQTELPLLLGIAAYMTILAWSFQNESYNVWGSMLIIPMVIGVNGIFLAMAIARQRKPWFTRILLMGFFLKLVGSAARYYVGFEVYGHGGDAARYNYYAATHLDQWRQGFIQWEPGTKAGTQMLELVTTAVYVFIGPAPIAGFVVFATFAFWGAYLLFRAFQTALPDGHHKRYALFVFLLPSMLYWPSSIGKEAWIMLGLGLIALGAAQFWHRHPGGLVLLSIGLLHVSLVRPHVTVLMTAALLVAQLLRPVGDKPIGLLPKLASLAVMAGAVAIMVTTSAKTLGIDDLSAQAVQDEIGWASGQTAQGGSAFEAAGATNPLTFMLSLFTVLFRPLFFEARNPQMIVQAIEGTVLLVLVVMSLPRIAQVIRHIRTNPYVAFSLVYAIAFTMAFSGFSNFGILARQRVLMMPFFLVLLCLPLIRKPGDGEDEDMADEPAEVAAR